MIGTITLNPCIDKTVVIQGFQYGEMNRVQNSRDDIAGKGINVSIVLTNLQKEVCTFGVDFKDNGQPVTKSLAKRGICYYSVVVDGNLRTNIKVMDVQTGITTEINEKGTSIDLDSLEMFTQLLDEALDSLDILVITGSVPPGVDTSYYRHLIERAKSKGINVILDAEGALLIEGMKAAPYLIKPNLYEFEMAFKLKSKDLSDILAVCHRVIQEGTEVVCLSMGSEGALIVDAQQAYICKPTNIEVQSTQGAGDSLVAGICIALEEGATLDDMLRYGVACAQGSLIKPGTLLCEKTDFEYFKQRIHVGKYPLLK